MSDLRHQQHLPNNVASHYCGPELKQAIWRKDCIALASQVGSPCLRLWGLAVPARGFFWRTLTWSNPKEKCCKRSQASCSEVFISTQGPCWARCVSSAWWHLFLGRPHIVYIVFPRRLPRIFFPFLIVYKIILYLKIVGVLYLIKIVSVTVIICDTLNDPTC